MVTFFSKKLDNLFIYIYNKSITKVNLYGIKYRYGAEFFNRARESR